MVFLTAIVWLVFGRTIGSFFLADDFGEVAYASRIYSGEYQLLWSDFTSNFMNIPGMAVWRPWLMISLLTDYAIWHANPLGFYLNNLLLYNAVVLLFYSLIRALAGRERENNSAAIAVLSAALFAVSPLHCESVSWVVGRVDILCACFYLACLNLSYAAERALVAGKLSAYKGKTTLAVICFWLAMWSKEMAIGAPVMVAAIILLFSSKPLNFAYMWRLCAPILVSTLAYLTLRYLALGTLLGGYVQGIGDSQAANAITRWLDPDTLKRLAFPFALSIFGDHPWQQTALQLIYGLLLILLLIRTLSLSVNPRWLALIPIWTLTCLAPIYKLWGLGYELEGGRFCFFLTLPLSLLAPALILSQRRRRNLDRQVNVVICSLGLIAIASAIMVLGKAAYANNIEWVHAGQETRALIKQSKELSIEAVKSGKQLLIIGIPKRHGGAHMILNGATFATALKPPLSAVDYTEPMITFEAVQFNETPYINSERFKRLADSNSIVVVWNSQERIFERIQFEQKSMADLNQIKQGKDMPCSDQRLNGSSIACGQGHNFKHTFCGDSLAFDNLNLCPLNADFIAARVKILDNSSAPLRLGISLDGKTEAFYHSDTISNDNGAAGIHREIHTVLIPLSKDWHWYSKARVKSIDLLLPPSREIELVDCKLLQSNQVAPKLLLLGGQESFEGIVSLQTSSAKSNAVDAEIIPPPLSDWNSIEVEISKANTFFENATSAAAENSVVMRKQSFKIKLDELEHEHRIKLRIDTTGLHKGTYYQLRARLVGLNGKRVGEPSCAVTVTLP